MKDKMKVRLSKENHLNWWCPACNMAHGSQGSWQFNGDRFDKPTFYPSFLVTGGHYIEGHTGDCWCTYNAQHPDDPSGFKCFRCHTFIKNGMIQYLSDCSHEYAGKTIPMEEF